MVGMCGVSDRGRCGGDGQGEMCGVTDRGDVWGDGQGEMCGVTDTHPMHVKRNLIASARSAKPL